MKKSIKYLIISVILLCIFISSYFYIRFQRFQMLPIYQVEYNAGKEMVGGHTYTLHYVRFKNHLYKSVNPFIYVDDYPLGKQIGRTEYEYDNIFAVKGHKDLIAVCGFMVTPMYFKEIKNLD